MEVPLAEAKAKFAELVRRAEQGDEIVVTRHGQPAAKIVPAGPKPKPDWDETMRRVEEIQTRVKAKMKPGDPDAAHSQDFLYDERGLPK